MIAMKGVFKKLDARIPPLEFYCGQSATEPSQLDFQKLPSGNYKMKPTMKINALRRMKNLDILDLSMAE